MVARRLAATGAGRHCRKRCSARLQWLAGHAAPACHDGRAGCARQGTQTAPRFCTSPAPVYKHRTGTCYWRWRKWRLSVQRERQNRQWVSLSPPSHPRSPSSPILPHHSLEEASRMGGDRGAAALQATACSRPLERSSNSQGQRIHQAAAAVQLTLHARDCDVRPRPSTVPRHEKARCCLRSWRRAGGIADDPVPMRSLAKTSSLACATCSRSL